MDTAARRLDVSTKTISRWVSGTTEPRLRDLYRIRDVFGEPPFH
jgi:transcriptional regulator with XRE-family HTH domain